jgi:hypothetical protein
MNNENNGGNEMAQWRSCINIINQRNGERKHQWRNENNVASMAKIN